MDTFSKILTGLLVLFIMVCLITIVFYMVSNDVKYMKKINKLEVQTEINRTIIEQFKQVIKPTAPYQRKEGL